MKRVAFLLLTVLLAACGRGSVPESPGGRPDRETDRTVAIYSAIARRLITVDHTFGAGEAPFRVIFIVDHAVEGAGAPTGAMDPNQEAEPFTEEIKNRLEDALAALPPVEFVGGPDEVMAPRSNFPRVKDKGAVVTLGPIPAGDKKVEVAAGLYFSALGGTWLTYVLERSGVDWEVTGTTGPASIS